MEVNELRINNLIYDDIMTESRVFAITSEINNDDLWEQYTPIPLTEKWMRKFGFITLDCEIDYIEWGLDDYDNGATFNIQSDGLDKRLPLYFVYDLGQYEIKREIKYIHQLQNLYFALTGKELTIKP